LSVVVFPHPDVPAAEELALADLEVVRTATCVPYASRSTRRIAAALGEPRTIRRTSKSQVAPSRLVVGRRLDGRATVSPTSRGWYDRNEAAGRGSAVRVVERRQRQVAWNAHAELAAGEHRSERELDTRCDERGRRLVQSEEIERRLPSLAKVPLAAGDACDRDARCVLRHRRLERRLALKAAGLRRRTRQQADPPMAVADEVVNEQLNAGVVVEDHAPSPLRRSAVEEHAGHSSAGHFKIARDRPTVE
jgi:hypothetical protein